MRMTSAGTVVAILFLVSSSAFADAYYDDYEFSGVGEDDECWYGGCHPDVRFADSVDCIQCPEVL